MKEILQTLIAGLSRIKIGFSLKFINAQSLPPLLLSIFNFSFHWLKKEEREKERKKRSSCLFVNKMSEENGTAVETADAATPEAELSEGEGLSAEITKAGSSTTPILEESGDDQAISEEEGGEDEAEAIDEGEDSDPEEYEDFCSFFLFVFFPN